MEKEESDQKNISIRKNMREASLQEIGDKLDLTRMRICQLEKIILNKLRESKILDEFK
jgi:DNA-directed RNA polymerase sigma subunit (sigma70/sigma32)